MRDQFVSTKLLVWKRRAQCEISHQGGGPSNESAQLATISVWMTIEDDGYQAKDSVFAYNDNSHSQLSTSGFLGSWSKMWLIYSYSTVHNICDSWTCMTATLSFLTPSLSDHMPTNEVRDLVSNANLLNKFSVALSNHWSNASISLSVSIPLSEFIS